MDIQILGHSNENSNFGTTCCTIRMYYNTYHATGRFSGQQFDIFSYFSKKIGSDISCKGDNLHEMQNPIFMEK